MMDALQQFSHRTLTENYAPAYDSTRSATLDAFHKLTHFSWSPGVGPLLEKVCFRFELPIPQELTCHADMGGGSRYDPENNLELEEHP
jgi:hypothetical protein